MKKNIIKLLKIILPLGIGVYLTWYFYSGLSQEEKEGIPKAFANANYFWVILSLVIAWLSHFSRAYRWKFQLEHLGYKPKLSSMYHSVMIGYIINLTIPRSGEFARAGFFSKKEKIPFDKVFGTIVAERVIDVIMLFGIFFITTLYVGREVVDDITQPKFEEKVVITNQMAQVSFTLEKSDEREGDEWKVSNDFSKTIKANSIIKTINDKKVNDISSFLKQNIGKEVVLKGSPPAKSNLKLYLILLGLILIGGLVFWKIKKLRSFILNKLLGLWEGVKSLFFLEKRTPFIVHTFFIWACYICMFWVCALGVGGVENIGLDSVLVCFVVGSVAMTATPGGIGLYPLFVAAALVYFGVNRADASGFSILMWLVQTLLILVFGLISLFAINVKFSNSEVEEHLKGQKQ